MGNEGIRPIVPPLADEADYRLLTPAFVERDTFRGHEVLVVCSEALETLAREAFHDTAFFMRRRHLEQLASILEWDEASENDRFVAASLLRNAVIAAEGVLPICQDTGTATVIAEKGAHVWTDGDDRDALSRGVRRAYQENALRDSQIAPLGLFDEANTGDNLPAQIGIESAKGLDYRFLFLAKGGGSSNKTVLHQGSKALLNPDAMTRLLQKTFAGIGVAACPPYHLAVVIGGTSPEATLKTVKLATAGALDALPEGGPGEGYAFRDPAYEAELLEITRSLGLGAQFGGCAFALDVRVVRLPRHAGSCPVGIGLSCSADRNARGRITRNGVFLESLDRDPARFLPRLEAHSDRAGLSIDLRAGMDATLAKLASCRPGTFLRLNGPLVVARDMAHARIAEDLDRGEGLPEDLRAYPVYYAGPAKTPPGCPTGSFGPTTAERMDGYVGRFMDAGGSFVMLGKGDRAPAVADACRRHGGVFLGTVGGAAALMAREHIRKAEVVAFPELGMEALRRIEVKDLPAFVVIDARGESLTPR